jgi:hypothetical protein
LIVLVLDFSTFENENDQENENERPPHGSDEVARRLRAFLSLRLFTGGVFRRLRRLAPCAPERSRLNLP